MGTPMAMLSIVEFQPQWVMKEPKEGCDRMTSYGAHDITQPRFLIRSKYTHGSIGALLGLMSIISGCTTHRNGLCVAPRPGASSSTFLPLKQMVLLIHIHTYIYIYITESRYFSYNHYKYLFVSSHKLTCFNK